MARTAHIPFMSLRVRRFNALTRLLSHAGRGILLLVVRLPHRA